MWTKLLEKLTGQKSVIIPMPSPEIQKQINKNVDSYMEQKSLIQSLQEDINQAKAIVSGIIPIFEASVPKPKLPKGAVIPLRNGKWTYVVYNNAVVNKPSLESHYITAYYSDEDKIKVLTEDLKTLKNFQPKWKLPNPIYAREKDKLEEYEDYASAMYALSVAINPEPLTTYFDENMEEMDYIPE